MGRSIYSIEGLAAPFLLADEMILEIPRGGAIYVRPGVSFRIVFFLEADHVLEAEGLPPIPLRAGDALILPSKVLLKYRARRNVRSRMHIFRLVFDLPLHPHPPAGRLRDDAPGDEADPGAFFRGRFRALHHLPGALTPARRERIAAIREEAEAHPPGARFLVGGLCQELAVDLARQLDPWRNGAPAPPTSKAALTVRRAKEFLQEHLAEPMTLEEVATQVSLSREHLARLFREVTGRTVFEHLAFLRISEAKRLLCNEGLLVHQVGDRTGFTSTSLFCRAFKNAVGMTPMEYRKQRLGEIRFSPSTRARPQAS